MTAPTARLRMLTWYKSSFRTSGTLGPDEYAVQIAAAFAFFFGVGVLGAILFSLLLAAMIAFHAPAWASYLLLLIWCPFPLVAVGSLIGIIIASTMRFAHHLTAADGSR